MRFFPIAADADFGDQRYAQLRHTSHDARDFGLHPGHFGVGYLKHQFIVHLHDHARGALLGLQRALHLDHAHLDEVGWRC